MTFTGLSIWTMAALLVGSAAILAVLHRLRIRPQTVWVNTTLFWNEALRRTRARSLWERFRHPLTYLLLLLIASLLIVALAGPRWSRDSQKLEHTVFVLDLSNSMSATSATSPTSVDAKTRLTLAKEKLIELVDRFPWPERFAVIVAGEEPRLIHAMGDLRPMLERRLETIEAVSVPVDRDHAVRLASSLLEGRENPSVCLITDRPFEDIGPDQVSPPCKVVQVGKPVSNAAILSAIFEPDAKNPLVGTLRVRAGLWPEGKATVKLTARREKGPLLAEKLVTVTGMKKDASKEAVAEEAGSVVELAVEQLAADGGWIVVEVTGDDALRADSVVRYRLPTRQPIRLLIENDLPDWLTILMKLDPTLVRSTSSDADVRLRVAASKPLSEPSRVVAVENTDGTTSLDDPAIAFEDLYCSAGIARDHFGTSITPLVTAGERLILASQPTATCPTLWLADVAWSDKSTLNRSAAWPTVVSRALRDLAGWTTSPVSLEPIVVKQMPALDAASLATMPGSRTSSDLTVVEATPSPTESTSFFTTTSAWPEWLLLAAFVLAVAEIVLHTRGRIA